MLYFLISYTIKINKVIIKIIEYIIKIDKKILNQSNYNKKYN
jgi:hypothetical protein